MLEMMVVLQKPKTLILFSCHLNTSIPV